MQAIHAGLIPAGLPTVSLFRGEAIRSSEGAKNGRGGQIRTDDLYVPNVALYQAKLHPDTGRISPAGPEKGMTLGDSQPAAQQKTSGIFSLVCAQLPGLVAGMAASSGGRRSAG
jgi:hypothetical protein